MERTRELKVRNQKIGVAVFDNAKRIHPVIYFHLFRASLKMNFQMEGAAKVTSHCLVEKMKQEARKPGERGPANG